MLDSPRDVSASTSTGKVPLGHSVSSVARHWRYETWWICEDVPENTFCEEDSGSWHAHQDPKTGRPYWCHETTDEWFWRRDRSNPYAEQSIILQRVNSSTCRDWQRHILLHPTPCICWACVVEPTDAFPEDTPHAWQLFLDPDRLRLYWWHTHSGVVLDSLIVGFIQIIFSLNLPLHVH